MARGDCFSVLSVCSVSYGQRWLCLWIFCLFCILWSEVIVSLDCLFVLYLMVRDDCVSGLSVCFVSYGQRWLSPLAIRYRTDNPETQSSLAIRYRTNRQSRDTITSDHKIQNKQTIHRHNHLYGQRWLCLCIVCLFCILWPEVIVSLDCLFVLYLMARGDCVSGLSVPLAIRYRTNRQSRDTIISHHKMQNKQTIQRHNHLWP
jgi:hypothetical protein